ncbi:MAG: hypothetical protein WBD46_15575 [Acidobacteriaceae bacterium]
MGRAARSRAAGVVALAGLMAAAACSGQRKPAPPAAPPDLQPAVRIEVAPLGYLPPSSFYLTYRMSSATLGFLDNDRVLFTFRVAGLLKRTPLDRPDDDDQEIRAVVLDLTTGKVVNQTEWRMYDRGAYLWPYPDGKFLVRVRDSLYLTDASLRLQPYLTFNNGLREVEISPDRSLTVLETNLPDKPGTERPAGPPSLSYSMSEGEKPVKILIVPSGSKQAVAVSDAQRTVMMGLMPDGIVGTLEGRKQASWVMQEVPFHGEPKLVAEMQSTCRPTAQPLSARVVLMTGCFGDGDDHPVLALSTDGRELWRDRWLNRYIWGWFDYAENGSRFVYESVAVNHTISAFEPLYPEDVTAQLAGVYDTETGKLVLVRNASPVLTAGQNVALSPDGTRFAILRQGAVEVYDLPPVSVAAPKPVPVAKRQK